MKRIKIKFKNPRKVAEFVNTCFDYDCDINLYDGKNVVDAKSVIGVFAISLGKVLEVQPITSDESVISTFIADMRKFEV